MEDFTTSSSLSADGQEFVPSYQARDTNDNSESTSFQRSIRFSATNNNGNFSGFLQNFNRSDTFQPTHLNDYSSTNIFPRLSSGIDSSSDGGSIFSTDIVSGFNFLDNNSNIRITPPSTSSLSRNDLPSARNIFSSHSSSSLATDCRCQFCGIPIRTSGMSSPVSEYCDACSRIRQQRQQMQGRQELNAGSEYDTMQFARAIREMPPHYISPGPSRNSHNQPFINIGSYRDESMITSQGIGFNPRQTNYTIQHGYQQPPRQISRPPLYNQPRPPVRTGRGSEGGYQMYTAPNSPKMGPPCILYFGGVLKRDSLIGGCAWWIADQYHETIAHGSDPVQQASQSLIRLEYEGLLNGLKAAFLKGIRVIQIKGSSNMVISHFKDRDFKYPYFQTLYHLVEDLSSAIANVLVQFSYHEFELISAEENQYTRKLSDNIINSFQKRKETRFIKRQTELMAQKKEEEALLKSVTNFVDH